MKRQGASDVQLSLEVRLTYTAHGPTFFCLTACNSSTGLVRCCHSNVILIHVQFLGNFPHQLKSFFTVGCMGTVWPIMENRESVKGFGCILWTPRSWFTIWSLVVAPQWGLAGLASRPYVREDVSPEDNFAQKWKSVLERL